jgi:hypothetical protein
LERDEERIRPWKKMAWPRIKKPLRERRFIDFIDESGLSEPRDAELVGARQSL